MDESDPTPHYNEFSEFDSEPNEPDPTYREPRDYFAEPDAVPDEINPIITNWPSGENTGAGGGQIEDIAESAPEDACLAALLDLSQIEPDSGGFFQSRFFEAYTGGPAPDGLRTSIMSMTTTDMEKYALKRDTPDGYEVIASASIGFEAAERIDDSLLNIDFVRTGEELLALKRQMVFQDGSLTGVHTRRLTGSELAALQMDATCTRQGHINMQLERTLLIGMGPIIEEAAEDGTRRFHVGDILTVMTNGVSMSPRDSVGDNDIVAYMTGELPNISQTSRFIQECQPLLTEQYEGLLGPVVEEILAKRPIGTVEAFQILRRTIESLGTTLLPVGKLDPEQHAVLDPTGEAALDFPSATILGNVEMPDSDKDEDR